MKIAILGGGFAGLSVALHLDPKFEVTLFEAERQLGGLCRSFEFEGLSYDIGPHIFFSKNQAVLKEILSLSGNLMESHERSNQIWYDRNLVKYPFENYLGLLPPPVRDYCLHTFVENPYRDFEPTNMLQFFLSRFGEGITQTYLRPYNEKIWKFDPAYLDLQMVERIPRPPMQDVIDGANGNPKEGYTHQLHFYYPKAGGAQSLIDALREKLPQNVHVLSDTRVVKVEKEKDRWRVATSRGEFSVDKIINCMPLKVLLPRLALARPERVDSAFAQIRHNSLCYGLAVFKKDAVGKNFSFNFPQPEFLCHRISKVNFLGKNRNVSERSGFLFEATYGNGTELSRLSDDEIRDRIARDMAITQFVDPADFIGIEIRREELAYVLYDLNHRTATDSILGFLREHGVFCCGRFAENEYLNTDHVFERSQRLCKQLNQEWSTTQ